jgi:hypothetical protein
MRMTRRLRRPTTNRGATKTYTPYLIAQASRVAEMLEAGYDNRRMGIELGVSKPRISQIRAQLRELAPYLGRPEPLDRLRSRRDQLWRLRKQVLELAATVRTDLRELDEELEAAEVDQVLGLRYGPRAIDRG